MRISCLSLFYICVNWIYGMWFWTVGLMLYSLTINIIHKVVFLQCWVWTGGGGGRERGGKYDRGHLTHTEMQHHDQPMITSLSISISTTLSSLSLVAYTQSWKNRQMSNIKHTLALYIHSGHAWPSPASPGAKHVKGYLCSSKAHHDGPQLMLSRHL